MLLSPTLSTLLVGLLAVLAPSDAHPVSQRRSVSMPLTKITRAPENIHPSIFLQQHINRSQKRLARMKGRTIADGELHANMVRRVASVAGGDAELEKRLWRNDYLTGVIGKYRGQGNADASTAAVKPQIELAEINKGGKSHKGANDNTNQLFSIDDLIDALTGNGGKGGKGGKGGNGGAAQDNGGGAASNSAASDASSSGAGNANSDTSAGFSDLALQAAIQGGLTQAEPPKDANSIGLDDEANDTGYVATIQIGNPPRDFHTLMDSGSADMWVGSENCQSTDGGDCGNHTFLGPQSSSSFVDTGNQFQVTYGTGAVSGDIVQDDITVAGLTLKAHTFGVATQETPDFSSNTVAFDGLIGLAQSTLSNQKVPTPPESLAAAGLIKDPITSYRLGRVSDGTNVGEITFGDLIGSDQFDPNTLVTLQNVNQNGFWESDLAVTINGKDAGLSGRTGILDTGTTLIIAPPADAEQFHSLIDGAKPDGQGGFTIPCTTNVQVAFQISGKSYNIDTRDLTFLPVDQNDPTGDCVSGVSSGQIGGDQEWLVGDVFLKNVMFSHNVADNSITLAQIV